MRTVLLAAMLLLSTTALAQDPPAADGAEEGTEEGAEEGTEEGTEGEDPDALPEVDVDLAIKVCKTEGLMDPCEVDGMIGLCQLEPCDPGWKDGARACKQCVPYAWKPKEEAPPEPELVLTEEEAKAHKGKGKGPRRVKKRECGCTSTGAPMGALGLGLVAPLIIRRRR